MVINMWISQRMMREKRVAEPQAGPVSLVGEGYLYAQGVREARDMPLFAPYGYAALPPEGEQAMMVPVGQDYVCLGVRTLAGELLPGEVTIASAGGAKIQLRNDGSVVINGLVITKDGELLGRGE